MAQTAALAESRVKKSILNAKVNLTFYFIILITRWLN